MKTFIYTPNSGSRIFAGATSPAEGHSEKVWAEPHASVSGSWTVQVERGDWGPWAQVVLPAAYPGQHFRQQLRALVLALSTQVWVLAWDAQGDITIQVRKADLEAWEEVALRAVDLAAPKEAYLARKGVR